MGSELSTGTAELRAQMAAFLRGEGDPQALVEAAQGAELLLPLLGEGAVWSGELDDIRWLFAFTSTGEMHAFLQQKWEAAEPDELPAELARYVRYLRVGGAELLQELLPELVERDRVPMGSWWTCPPDFAPSCHPCPESCRTGLRSIRNPLPRGSLPHGERW